REAAARLLGWHLDHGTPVVVVTPRSTWSASAGGTDWTEIERLQVRPLVPAGLALAGTGAVVGLVGLVPTLSAQGRALDAASSVARATGPGPWADGEAAYGDAVDDLRRWRAVAGVGAAVGGAGLAVTMTGFSLGPRSVRPERGR